MTYEAVVVPTVAEGRLVRLFQATTIPFTIYAIAIETARRDDPLIRSFRDWLLSEISDQSTPSTPIRAAG